MILTATLIGAVTVGDMVASIIASYAANHIPPITHPDFDSHAARSKQRAAEKFRALSDVHAALYPKISTVEKWKEYMKSEDNLWVSELLTQLWIEELLHEPLCQIIGIHKQLESIKQGLTEISKTVIEDNELLKEIKAIVSRSQEKAETEFKENPQYIKCYCADNGSSSTFLHFAGIDSEQTILDYVLAESPKGQPSPRLALYGGMQRGKSTELEHLGWQLLQSGRFIPILYRLKYFKELHYEDLPAVEPGQLPIVLLIDALDETSEQHFSQQLKEVSLYAKRHQDIRIVVSCRSNFQKSYLLEDFKSLELLPLRQQEISKYVSDRLSSDTVRFFDQVRTYQLGDLICHPLELQALVEAFHTKHTLPQTRSAVYHLLYEKAISIETTKGVKDDLITPEEELRCLERVAVVMLQLGKRELTEALQILSVSLMDKTPLQDLFNKTNFNDVKEQFGPLIPGLFD